MGNLIVNAMSEDTIAAPGNRQPNYIVVSVTKSTGVPVLGLGVSNFKVDPVIVGPGGALVNITGVSAGRLPGIYLINVLPISTQTWKRGVYIFAVAVKSASTTSRIVDQGQNLCSVLMD